MEENTINIEDSGLLKGLTDENDINFFTEKFNEFNIQNHLYIKECNNFYQSGLRVLFDLSKKLSDNETIDFWKEYDVSDFINQVNNMLTLSNLLNRYLYQLDNEVESLKLLVKDYFLKIATRIRRNK